jgi:RNA polymerase sigma factor (sigma-70 family)
MSPFIDSEDFRNLLYSWPEKAMRSIYDHVYDDLVRIADMHTHSRILSEDALQDVFTDVFLRHREICTSRGESILGYLIAAVTNHSISLYRKNSRALGGETEYYYACVEGVREKPLELAMISEERQSFLRLIIGTLPPRERECMLLRIDHEMSVKEIARRLGVSKKAVEWNLRSARKRLERFRAQVP